MKLADFQRSIIDVRNARDLLNSARAVGVPITGSRRVSASFSAAGGARYSPSREEFWRVLTELADAEHKARQAGDERAAA